MLPTPYWFHPATLVNFAARFAILDSAEPMKVFVSRLVATSLRDRDLDIFYDQKRHKATTG